MCAVDTCTIDILVCFYSLRNVVFLVHIVVEVSNLVPRIFPGREPERLVLCMALIIELLPTQSGSKFFPALKYLTIIVVELLDLAGTYGSALKDCFIICWLAYSLQ